MEEVAALVIGGGPAGLMAADTLAAAGRRVILADAMPTLGRKFLMAGKSGLNLTKSEPAGPFLAAYGAAAPWLSAALDDFGPEDVQHWARGLGQEVFTGSTGRVFPVAMKASPLLRAWLARLEGLGVVARPRWRWTARAGDIWEFATPQGPRALRAGVVVLALGGASWARLGSDGRWAAALAEGGIALAPFAPANVGVSVRWSGHMAPFFGQPLKGIALSCGGQVSRGEVVLSARGLEGGGIYPLCPALRVAGAGLTIDLLPDRGLAWLAGRLARPRGKLSVANHLRRAVGLDPVKRALLREFCRPLPDDPARLAETLKALPLRHEGLRPLDEAISTAGGVRADALDGSFMLEAWPGVFCAGEMLDWEAPTGGYLITGCLATGRAAGQAAARWLARA